MLRSLLSQMFPRSRREPQPTRVDARAAALSHARELLAENKLDEATAAVGGLLAGEPEWVDAILLQARILRRRGALEEAKQAYRRALVFEPRRAEAWLDLGVCHHLSGDDFWARVYFRFANVLDPDNADVYNEFGLVEITLGNFEKAEESLENAVNRRPDHPEAWNNLGLVLARRGDLQNARRHFLRATFLRPRFYMAQCNLGLVNRDLELLDEAETVLRRALDIDAGPVTARLNLSGVLQDLGRLDEALELLESVRRDVARDTDVLAALSALLLKRGEARRAIEVASESLAIDAEHADSRLALAHAQLACGDFAEGWRNYEARLRATAFPIRHFAFPEWRAEDVRGKTVFVFGEQGLGDEIMFASCLPDLEAAGARVLLSCDKRLGSLMKRSFADVELVEDLSQLEAEAKAGTRPVDFCVPLGSLPRRFRGSREAFPVRGAYLTPDAQRTAHWSERVRALGDGLKVGISWRGGLFKTGRELRSTRLDALLPVLRVPGVRWVNLLHKGHREELDAVRQTHGIEIASWDEALADMEENAALIACLDLVVTVCSTVVHLAGALGKRVWVMTPHAPAWRYLLQGDAMPWYPTVRLYRQRDPATWSDVVGTLADDLRHCAAAGTGR